jgi:hypothetical protein
MIRPRAIARWDTGDRTWLRLRVRTAVSGTGSSATEIPEAASRGSRISGLRKHFRSPFSCPTSVPRNWISGCSQTFSKTAIAAERAGPLRHPECGDHRNDRAAIEDANHVEGGRVTGSSGSGVTLRQLCLHLIRDRLPQPQARSDAICAPEGGVPKTQWADEPYGPPARSSRAVVISSGAGSTRPAGSDWPAPASRWRPARGSAQKPAWWFRPNSRHLRYATSTPTDL